MANAIVQFPKGFLWGSATASHQVEGNNNNNNWYQWENLPGKIKNEDKSGIACDWWGGRWKEDMDRAKETGQNAHRFSVEWSRIQPQLDTWDDSAIDRYRAMLQGMLDRGIKPMVTLHHFSNPIWFEEMGGWENDQAPELFDRFVRRLFPAIMDYTDLWVTINEPNVYAYSGYVSGDFPPGKKNINTAFLVMLSLLKAHARAYHSIHEFQPEAKVGMAINYRSFLPATRSPLDKWVAKTQSGIFNDLFPIAATKGVARFLNKKVMIPEAANTQDFIGLNYYSRDRVSFDLTKPMNLFGRLYYPKDADLSPTGFIANEPEGFYEAIKWSANFRLPIFITENGVEDETDQLRPRYLGLHIHKLWRAVNYNWPILGYFHWSLVDNFEWERGWTQRFGLWGLDLNTRQRIRRKSVDFYAAICKANGLSNAMIQEYCPEIADRVFPD